MEKRKKFYTGELWGRYLLSLLICLAGIQTKSYEIAAQNSHGKIDLVPNYDMAQDEVDSEGFKYVNEFSYVKDISNYVANYDESYFTDCTQHITDASIMKANVFCVENFYGLSENQSYGRMNIYADKDLTTKIGEFNFCWAFYSVWLFVSAPNQGYERFYFVDAYDNMAIGETKQLRYLDGTTYTITLLDKIASSINSQKKLVFSVDRPFYFGGNDNASNGIMRFSNRVQIKYVKEIVSPSSAVIKAPTPKMVTYTGLEQELVEAGVASDGTMQYSLDDINYSTSIPTGIYAIDYILYYKVVGDAYHSDTNPATISVTIQKAPLTITAKSYTITQGDPMPTFECTYNGFKNDETEGVLTTKPIVTCSAISTSTPGTYDIVVSGAEAQNYDFSYVSGTLTINSKPEEEQYTYVDLGLPSGLMWADSNVGARSPSESGDLYAWGETVPKSSGTWANYLYGNSKNNLTKYNKEDGLRLLESEDDAATVNMGPKWRTPTKMEWEELTNQCTRTWVNVDGVNGFRFTGKNGNSIFLPAWGDNNWHQGAGAYWCSDMGNDLASAYNIDFDRWSFYIDELGERDGLRTVRAVYDESIVLKCKTPTIAYSKGELKFNCETKDVQYVYDVKVDGSKSGLGNNVQLNPIFTVSVYATKEGYENSDVVTKDIQTIFGDANGDGNVDATDVTLLINKILGKE